MNAEVLYEQDSQCRCFIAQWIAGKRCPPGFADYLNEHDAPAAANAAWWAEREPDRLYTVDLWCGPFPIQVNHPAHELGLDTSQYGWTWHGTFADKLKFAYDYPGSMNLYGKTCELTIVELLDSCRDKVFDPTKDLNKGMPVKGAMT